MVNKKICAISKGSHLEQVQKNTHGDWLTHIHVENTHSTGGRS